MQMSVTVPGVKIEAGPVNFACSRACWLRCQSYIKSSERNGDSVRFNRLGRAKGTSHERTGIDADYRFVAWSLVISNCIQTGVYLGAIASSPGRSKVKGKNGVGAIG